MAYTRLTPVDASRFNPQVVDPTTADPGAPFAAIDEVNGNDFVNKTNRMILIVFNTNATNTLTMTVKSNKVVDGVTLPDIAESIATESMAIFGPYPASQEQTGKVVEIDWSGTAPDGKVLALEIGQNDE